MEWFCGPALSVLLGAGSQLFLSAGLTDMREAVSDAIPVLQQMQRELQAGVQSESVQLVSAEAPMRQPEPGIGEDTFDLAGLRMSLSASASSGEDRPASKSADAEVPRPLRRRVLVFKAGWCGACQSLNYEWPKLQAVKWRIGSSESDHFQIVDVDLRPDLMARYGVAQLPTLILIEDDREIRRTGATTAWHLAEFYHGR